jgi:hypothetical protein
MNSQDLTPRQAEALRQTIGRQLRYLNRLCARAQALRWPLDDPVVTAAQAARNALQDLYTMTHYAACKHGVGRRSD